MKGRMDVLNLKKQLNSETQSESMCNNVIKIEHHDELDEERYGDEDYVTDLTINDQTQESENSEPEHMKDEVFATEIMEEDDDELEPPQSPLFSMILKEESPSDPLILNKNESVRSRVEIKYEDDIEEEEYDSDVDSLEQSEMKLSLKERENAMNFMNVNGRNIISNPENVPYHFASDYFDASNFQFTDHEGSMTDKRVNGDQNRSSDKSSDSILLSIVYATINVPFSQVSKFLAAYNLSKSQLSVIRKVRRQVKNRLYAQNCRRRRVAHIENLANELQQIKVEKEKLCNVRANLMAKLADIENRYKQFYAYVMDALKEKYRNDEYEYTDSNMNENCEQIGLQKRKLSDEYEMMETKKQRIEQKYEKLYEHVFQVIGTRIQSNGIPRNGMDSNIEFKLNNLDIMSELAILNKYWTKNNLKPNEQHDFESSISIDGSRTSESKLNDFVDFESSVSIDGSRTEENKLNDFIDYESSVDESIQGERREVSQSILEPDLTMSVENEEVNDRISDPLITWSDNSEDEEDESDEEFDRRLAELLTEKESLEEKKKNVMEQYEKLYSYVLETSQIEETEFLKVFVDYCIRLLKAPEQSTSADISDGS